MSDLEVFIIKNDNLINEHNISTFSTYISKEKLDCFNKCTFLKNIECSILGDLLVRYVICNKIGFKNKDLVFSTNKYGKPILIHPNGIQYNVSHSNNWVVCAIDDYKVGIDVETIKMVDHRIAKRFYTTREYNYIYSKPVPMQNSYFYIYWTLKESYIKAEGRGLTLPLNSFDIILDNEKNATISNDKNGYYMLYNFLDDNTICSVCGLKKTIKYNFINPDTFLENILKI